jgi:hypothetical protein
MPQDVFQCEILRAMIVQIVIFRAVTRCSLVDKYNFLEEHAVPMFRIEVENGDSIFLRNVVFTHVPYGVKTLKTTI